MNGIHEVVGSIPISSTNDIKRLAEIGYPFFIPDVTQGADGVQMGAIKMLFMGRDIAFHFLIIIQGVYF